jgi:hypothetical protein
LEPGTAAELAARGIVPESEAVDEASRNGIASSRLRALTALAQTFPGLADLDKLSNRGLIDDAAIEAALTRHGYPAEWHAPLVRLFSDLLSPAEVAAAVQQGHLPNDGILPDVSAAVSVAEGAVTPEAPDGQPPSHVPLTQIDLNPTKEAAGAGVNRERLEVMANLAGLPPGADTVLQMWNRGLIDEETVDAGIREGHLKTKWGGAFKRMRWAVLGGAEYAGLHLRGWITQQEMYQGGALTGHTKDQMDKLYLNRGRPLAPVQAFTAWARGAPHPKGQGYPDRPGTFDQQDFQRALQQSDVRTEYGPILWHNRFAYPPLFQLGRLAQAGALPEARVREILHFERYEPQDIDALAEFWYGGGGAAKAEPHVVKAQNQLWTAIHKAFVKDEIDEPRALAALTPLIASQAVRDQVLTLWTQERDVTVKELTPSQIKAAYKKNGLTIDEAVARLEQRGMTEADARLYLTT